MKCKEKTFLTTLVFAILVFISSSASAAPTESIDYQLTVNETQITTNGSFQDSPAIYGDKIVWSDNRNGFWDIYMYDLSTKKETQITTNLSSQYNPAIYEDKIVWKDTRRDFGYDVYMYDLSTSTETYISRIAWNNNPSIYGDKIVWMVDLGGTEINMYDISTKKKTQIKANDSISMNAVIHSDRIVWQDYRNGNWDIYMYNISTSKETPITTNTNDQTEPAIYEDRIVWKDYRNGWDKPEIYIYNLSTSTETQVTTNGSLQGYSASFSKNLAIYGDNIVWDYRNGDENWDIYMYNLSTSNEIQITTNNSNQRSPAIYSNRIVWTDNRNGNYDIYVGSVSNNPAANFFASPTSGIAPLEVSFTDKSTGLFTSRKWTFGDGKSSTEKNPVHVYSEAGKYTVNLTISNGNDTSSKFIEIIAEEAIAPPIANFRANATSGYVPFSVQFTDCSENATSRLWDFNNDGVTDSTEKNPVYVYTSLGTYTVNLTVCNTKGTALKQTKVTASPLHRLDGQLILTETRITTNESMQTNPSIYGDRIVWDDWRRGGSGIYMYKPGIYMYDLSISREIQIPDYITYSGAIPGIYNDKILWIYGRNIYVYNISTSNEIRINTNNLDKYDPAIYGDKIVWADSRNGNSDIYMYDLSNSKETQITTNESSQGDPAIYGDKIVWRDERNEKWNEYGPIRNSDIYMYNLSTSKEFQITFNGSNQESPAIYGDRIVWMDKRNGNWDIYMYDLSTSKETQITNNELVERYPAIFGDKIVWESYRKYDKGGVIDSDNYHIYMFDICTSKETKITTVESYKGDPAIYGDRIVWRDDRNGNTDIYMCTVKNNLEFDGSTDDSGIDEDISNGGSHHSSGVGSSGGTGVSPEPAKNVKVREISQAFITNGKPVKFDFPKNATSVVSLNFDSKKTAGKTTTIVEMLKNKSTLTLDEPEGKVYNYLNIWVGNGGYGTEKNIENAVIFFKVEKFWIQDKGIDQSSVTLNRYNDKKWNKLPTSLLGENDKYLYFIAQTPGFSPFAITGEQVKKESGTQIKPEIRDVKENNKWAASDVEQQSENQENASTSEKQSMSTPGFEIVYAMVCLLGLFPHRR